MANKTWTATDISKTGAITITEVSPGKIRFRQPYHFLDENGIRIDVLKEDHTLENIDWFDIPEPIQNALLEIREFLYQMALTKHEMNGGD